MKTGFKCDQNSKLFHETAGTIEELYSDYRKVDGLNDEFHPHPNILYRNWDGIIGHH